MGFFNRNKKAVEETRSGELQDVLLEALVGEETISSHEAMQIPTVAGCVNLISNTISIIPIKLYHEAEGQTKEVVDDVRVRLINDETGDSLDGHQFKAALVKDYLLSKGGYAYIHRKKNEVKSIHYLRSSEVTITKNADPVFKKAKFLVGGQTFQDYQLIKVLRATEDGFSGKSIVAESNKCLKIAFETLNLENDNVTSGGNKSGFLKSLSKIDKTSLEELKLAWADLYKTKGRKVIILNDGIDFKETSASSVEMQMNEHKETNSKEICRLFNVPVALLTGDGGANDEQYQAFIKLAIMPILDAIISSFNKELLLESEKGSFYFAPDTSELLKGDIEKRYKAYSEAVRAGWITKNEIRYLEDRKSIEGLDVVTYSLGDVVYDVNEHVYFTPNKDVLTKIEEGGFKDES